ncbi:unnamed protein product [Cylicocyclus nassatus]|uniref:SET domain-containing protein n=1 Tax=Cylicocyclus nassatus TaxID=53992 RepID=A0AA36GW45_CYLNA|nr:unnamed protein product [Cylicocyclus nassatus]
METDFFPLFTKHNSLSELSDGVSLRYDSKKGRHGVATRDIPCGEVVCVDEGKVVNLDENLCCYCLASLPTDCKTTYCESCTKNEELYGCIERSFANQLKELGMFRLAMHLVLSYPPDEILSCLKSGDFPQVSGAAEVLDMDAMKSSVVAALSLQTDDYPVDLSATDSLVKDIVGCLDKHPSWKMIPRGRRPAYFRTLLKLISARLMRNAHSIYFVDSLERHAEGAIPPMPSGVGLFPIACCFNHSCRANVNSFFYKNKLIFISMGIRKGEEICDNYGASFFKQTRQERAGFLAGRGFTCECPTCLTDDSIDDKLEPIIEHPDLILKSLPNVKDYRQYRNALPDGHKIIETIAEMYVGSVGGNEPKERSFLYGEVLECQRKRGLHFSPEQIRILLNCVLADYDAACKTPRKKQKHMENMQVHLFGALVRMRTFYGKLYPAYDAAKALADELIEMEGTNTLKNLSNAIEKLRAIVEDLKPGLPMLE